MRITNDQYNAWYTLNRWWKKHNHQYIDIDTRVGTGAMDVIDTFILNLHISPRQVVYLSLNQKDILDLAYMGRHAYYIYGFMYDYYRIYDLDTIPVINFSSRRSKFRWVKELKKEIDERYRLIVVLDSTLLSEETIQDLGSFGLPVILLRDNGLLPSPDSFLYPRQPNISITEMHPEHIRNPINYYAHIVLHGQRLKMGNYDSLNILSRRRMNLHNLKTTDMVIVFNSTVAEEINTVYREKIMKKKYMELALHERMVLDETVYGVELENEFESRIKVYLTKGVVGSTVRLLRYYGPTRYVPFQFQADFYQEPFVDIALDRYYLNRYGGTTEQLPPDDVVKATYAYALTPDRARLSRWSKITILTDDREYRDGLLYQKMMYTAVTRSTKFINVII